MPSLRSVALWWLALVSLSPIAANAATRVGVGPRRSRSAITTQQQRQNYVKQNRRRRTLGMMRMMLFKSFDVWTGGLGMMMMMSMKKSNSGSEQMMMISDASYESKAPVEVVPKGYAPAAQAPTTEQAMMMGVEGGVMMMGVAGGEGAMMMGGSEGAEGMMTMAPTSGSSDQMGMFLPNYVHGTREEYNNVVHHLNKYYQKNKVTSLNQGDDSFSGDDDAMMDDDAMEIDRADQIFAVTLLGVALMLILCSVAAFSACCYRRTLRKRREFESLVAEVKETVESSCEELRLPFATGEELEPVHDVDEEEAVSDITKDSAERAAVKIAPATLLGEPRESDCAASYFKDGTLGKFVIRLNFLERQDPDDRDAIGGWLIAGQGRDETKGDFQVTEGLLSRTGQAYWVQQYKKKRRWLVSGQWDLLQDGTFVGKWVTDCGSDGPFVSFEGADAVIQTDPVDLGKGARATSSNDSAEFPHSTSTSITFVTDDFASASSSSKSLREASDGAASEDPQTESEANADKATARTSLQQALLTTHALRAWDELSQQERPESDVAASDHSQTDAEAMTKEYPPQLTSLLTTNSQEERLESDDCECATSEIPPIDVDEENPEEEKATNQASPQRTSLLTADAVKAWDELSQRDRVDESKPPLLRNEDSAASQLLLDSCSGNGAMTEPLGSNAPLLSPTAEELRNTDPTDGSDDGRED